MAPPATRGYVLNTVEKKVFDTEVDGTDSDTTGVVIPIFTPPPGTGISERVGRKVQIKSIYLRGFVCTEAAATPGTGAASEVQMSRLIIGYDMQPNGSSPAVLDVLEQAKVYSQLNINNRDRFRIIKDKQWVFDPFIYNSTAGSALIGVNRTGYPLKIYKKCNMETIFNGNNGHSAADVTTGLLFVLLITSTAAGTDKNVLYFFSTRVRYTDI